jgi:hypothetical protein
MRFMKLFRWGFELGSLRWRGAAEFGIALFRGKLLWTWRHKQGVIGT